MATELEYETLESKSKKVFTLQFHLKYTIQYSYQILRLPVWCAKEHLRNVAKLAQISTESEIKRG